MQITVHSNIGKRRSTNQDYADYYTNPTGQTLFILCDGVGGNQAGDIASEMTTKFLGERFKALEFVLTAHTIEEWLTEAIIDVNKMIYDFSLTETKYNGMSTTLVMGIHVEDHIYIAHAGDSRAYVYNEGELIQLTEDHSLVNELIRSGQITRKEGENHPQRNVVTQSIGGTSQIESEITQIPVNQVEVLMLCSDGLTNMVQKDELAEYFKHNIPDDEFGKLLIDAANNAGGTDNITVILVSQFSTTIESGGDI